jgi:hypothetical protein
MTEYEPPAEREGSDNRRGYRYDEYYRDRPALSQFHLCTTHAHVMLSFQGRNYASQRNTIFWKYQVVFASVVIMSPKAARGKTPGPVARSQATETFGEADGEARGDLRPGA